MNTSPTLDPETEARQLRDAIYGPQKWDDNWAACKAKWIADLPWLRAHAPAHICVQREDSSVCEICGS